MGVIGYLVFWMWLYGAISGWVILAIGDFIMGLVS